MALALVSCGKSTEENVAQTNPYIENLDLHHPLYPSVIFNNNFNQGNYYFSNDFNISKVTIESLLRLAADQRYGHVNRLPSSIQLDPITTLFQQADKGEDLLNDSNDLDPNYDDFLASLRRASYLSHYTLIGLRDVESVLMRNTYNFFHGDNAQRLRIFRAINLYFDYVMAEYRFLQSNINYNWQGLFDQNRVEINFTTANFPEYLQQYNTLCQVGAFNLDVGFVQRGVGSLNDYYQGELAKFNTNLRQTCQMVNIFLQLTALDNYPDFAKAVNTIATEYAAQSIVEQLNHYRFGTQVEQAFAGDKLNSALINVSMKEGAKINTTYNDYVRKTATLPAAKLILTFEPYIAPLTLPDYLDSTQGLHFFKPSK
ncbi:hypothetical protein [Psittacicella hinzii]|uniref:Uncharacterized protein n=1 Tax=Psittacicella hinzii TaxID=2028575 RepID=A0A3A1YVW2_9GAMM|nr:hypothetical protein [Psittacicella hinzii]RIY40604.1 hypothetical protein CKF58_00345 [Psittacicella hinzii]